ncbi:MAG: dicarboxylate/amino acid:cation symporter [Lachnospiraceae bacterium]|nr:dicarboxylate/amino acid:cation symporter [Lachnospiraceae bacterium]
MFATAKFPLNNDCIKNVTEFVSDILDKHKVSQKDKTKAILILDEATDSLIKHGNENTEITVSLKSFLGTIHIELLSQGEEYSLASNMSSSSLYSDDGYSDDIYDNIQNIILKSLPYNLKYKHKNGKNSIFMTVVKSKHIFLYQTLGAMAIAILLGIIFANAVPAEINTALNDYIFEPIKTMYMNALKMVVAPVVFLSITSCLVQFSDLTSLGRIGGKIIGFYLFTTVLSILLGIGIFFLMQPGDASLATNLMTDSSSITSTTIDVSIKDTIINIVPTNIIEPFYKNNMLQLIFIATLLGIATSLITNYSDILKNIFQALNELFLKVTSLIIKLIPIAIFCSIMSMMITIGIKTLLSVLAMFGTVLVGYLAMTIFYYLLIFIVGKLNPIPFAKKYAPTMLQVFSLSSSNAAIPINMEACDKMLGIKRKIYSLSIPIGATLNMSGTCIHLAIFALALAKAYGVPLSGSIMISIVISIIVLSMGSPGIPGSGLICLSVLIAQIGIPIEAIGLIMGIDPLCSMFRTMINCLGDVAVSTIVAKDENEMDMAVYQS